MQTNIIEIGNSKGIRLSKTILEQCRIIDKVDLKVKENCIILKPIKKKKIRQNWQKAFEKMAIQKEDKLLIEDVLDDDQDWQW